MTRPVVGGESRVPDPDPIAADHLRLALRLEPAAALLTPERAEKRLEFIEHLPWRTYVFVY